MTTFYKKISAKKYQPLSSFEYGGVPANGFWGVSQNGHTQLMSPEEMVLFPSSCPLMVFQPKIIDYFKKTEQSFEDQLQQTLVDINNHKIPRIVPFKSVNVREEKIDLYIKKNGRYQLYGKAFTAFEKTGFYHVTDGLNNKAFYLGNQLVSNDLVVFSTIDSLTSFEHFVKHHFNESIHSLSLNAVAKYICFSLYCE